MFWHQTGDEPLPEPKTAERKMFQSDAELKQDIFLSCWETTPYIVLGRLRFFRIVRLLDNENITVGYV